MVIIRIEALESGQHPIESQSHRPSCWMDGWIEVPTRLEAGVWASGGWCDLTIENGVLVGITQTERPEPEPEPTPAPTQLDRVEAQATYTAMITDTLLPEV